MSVRQFGIFPRNGSLFFSNFWHNGIQLEYLKTHRADFPGKLIFAQIWAKSAKNDPKKGFFGFFKNFCH